MKATWWSALAAAVTCAALLNSGEARAQYYTSNFQPNLYNNPNQAYQLSRFYYYPYYYFPHNYWPATSPRYPELPGQPYMAPPARTMAGPDGKLA